MPAEQARQKSPTIIIKIPVSDKCKIYTFEHKYAYEVFCTLKHKK